MQNLPPSYYSCPPYEGGSPPQFIGGGRGFNSCLFGVILILSGILFSVFPACSARKSKPTQLRIHPTNWTADHPNFIFSNNLQTEYGQACKSCHGNDYTGGTSGFSCVSCHNARRDTILFAGKTITRPAACIGCHGGGFDPIDSTFDTTGAPPYSLLHDSLYSDRGVGGHPAMVNGGPFFTGTDCYTCHPKPAFVLSSAHFSTATRFTFDSSGQLQVLPSGGRAEVVFSGLAQLYSSLYGAPVFDTLSHRCANVYCHGSFPGGNRWQPFFYDGSGEADCGTCHAAKTGNDFTKLSGRHRTHNPDSLSIPCVSCHFGTVVGPDSINLSTGRHVDGVFDVVFDPAVAPNAAFDRVVRSCNGVPGGSCHVISPADTLWDN